MKYTNALYPDKINDLIDNDGSIKESMQSVISAAVLPELPEGAAEKTFALQAINGVLTWVEVEEKVPPEEQL